MSGGALRKRRPDMDKIVSKEMEDSVSFEAFVQQNKLCRLWKIEESQADFSDAGALPLETFLNQEGPLPANPDKLKDLLKEKVQGIQAALRQAKRNLVLSRSHSLGLKQAVSLLANAEQNYETAQKFLVEVKTLVRRMGPEDRRRVRALEGAAEWRRLRHAIQQNRKTLKSLSEEIAA